MFSEGSSNFLSSPDEEKCFSNNATLFALWALQFDDRFMELQFNEQFQSLCAVAVTKMQNFRTVIIGSLIINTAIRVKRLCVDLLRILKFEILVYLRDVSGNRLQPINRTYVSSIIFNWTFFVFIINALYTRFTNIVKQFRYN